MVSLADVINPRGGTWSKNDVLLYTPNILDPLVRINAAGGTPSPVTDLAKTGSDTHRWPWFLPDGKHFLFLSISHAAGETGKPGIYFGSLDSPEAHFVVATNSAAQFGSGYLLYHANNDLMAQPFDPVTGTQSGTPVVLIDSIRNDSGVWRTVFSTSQNGRLIYQSGSAAAAGTKTQFFDRQGKQLTQVRERANTAIDVRLSPDGKRLAIAEANGIWIEDLERKTRTRMTFGQQLGQEPSWSPDGKMLVYGTGLSITGAGSAVDAEIRALPADGSGQAKTLLKIKSVNPVPSWSDDGKYLAYIASNGGFATSIWITAASGEGPQKSNAAAAIGQHPGSRLPNLSRQSLGGLYVR